MLAQTDETLRSPEPIRAAQAEIQAALRPLKISPLNSDRNVRGDVVALNGIPTLVAFGAKNHDSGMSQRLVGLLSRVGTVAGLSEGMLWTADEASGNWRVHTLKHGEVTAHDDPWFSTPGWFAKTDQLPDDRLS